MNHFSKHCKSQVSGATNSVVMEIWSYTPLSRGSKLPVHGQRWGSRMNIWESKMEVNEIRKELRQTASLCLESVISGHLLRKLHTSLERLRPPSPRRWHFTSMWGDKWVFSKIMYKTNHINVISTTLLEIASYNFLEYWFTLFKVEPC